MLKRQEIETVFAELPTLDTARLRLVPLRIEHSERRFALYSDPAVMGALGHEVHADPAVSREWDLGVLERHKSYSGITWSLFLNENDRLVGSCAMHGISWRNRRTDVGFELARDCWGQGLMREGLTAVLRFAFTDLRFIKVSAHVAVDNQRSQVLLGRLGFKEEGLLRHHGFWGGEPRDLRAYSLLHEEFGQRPPTQF